MRIYRTLSFPKSKGEISIEIRKTRSFKLLEEEGKLRKRYSFFAKGKYYDVEISLKGNSKHLNEGFEEVLFVLDRDFNVLYISPQFDRNIKRWLSSLKKSERRKYSSVVKFRKDIIGKYNYLSYIKDGREKVEQTLRRAIIEGHVRDGINVPPWFAIRLDCKSLDMIHMEYDYVSFDGFILFFSTNLTPISFKEWLDIFKELREVWARQSLFFDFKGEVLEGLLASSLMRFNVNSSSSLKLSVNLSNFPFLSFSREMRDLFGGKLLNLLYFIKESEYSGKVESAKISNRMSVMRYRFSDGVMKTWSAEAQFFNSLSAGLFEGFFLLHTKLVEEVGLKEGSLIQSLALGERKEEARDFIQLPITQPLRFWLGQELRLALRENKSREKPISLPKSADVKVEERTDSKVPLSVGVLSDKTFFIQSEKVSSDYNEIKTFLGLRNTDSLHSFQVEKEGARSSVGERPPRTREAAGSNPAGSTFSTIMVYSSTSVELHEDASNIKSLQESLPGVSVSPFMYGISIPGREFKKERIEDPILFFDISTYYIRLIPKSRVKI